MRGFTPANSHVVAVLVALTAALIARSWLQVTLRDSGLAMSYAADLSYLVVPPVLLFLLLPVLRKSKDGLRDLFDASKLNVRFALYAIAIGLLIRLAWWCQLITGISLGIFSNDSPNAAVGPLFEFQCPPLHVLALGFLVMAILVPVTEEILHRGFVQSALYRFGPHLAIIGSAVVFAVFHPPGSWGFVLFAGLIFGTQYWITKSLWSSLITHATINALIQIDWRCLRGQWNPPAQDVPLVVPGVLAVLLLITCIAAIYVVLWQMHRGDVSPR